LCSAKVLSQDDSKFAELVLQGEKKTACKTLLHFKRYNLAIYEGKFFETFSTYYFNGRKQNTMIESQKIKIKINLCNLHYNWQLWSILFKNIVKGC
jgi:hypothetical protein